MSEPVLELEGLGVTYGHHRVLSDVSLAVAPGEVLALLGRNGSGKSSLVRCLLGHQKPTAGRARLFASDTWGGRAAVMERVGVVPEEGDAPPAMTVRQLSRFCARLYPRWDEDGLRRRLDGFGVPGDVPFGRLSKGQKGQVMLALALASQPELLVLDDPTLGLDAVARREVFEEVVGELADRGTTVFVTSHDLAGIEGVASRVAFLIDAGVAIDEDLETLKARFRRLRVGPAESVGLDALEPLRVSRQGRDVEAVVGRFDADVFARLAAEHAFERTEVAALGLEEIFVALTRDAKGGRS